MESYLIKLTPLEAYFFGGEQNFSFGKNSRETKSSYFIRSLNTPSQTTLLGALRYAVLAAENALITDYGSEEQKLRCKELVGEKSFSLNEERTYGKIDSISSLFIVDGDTYFVPAPMNHDASKKSYSPLNVESCNEVRVSAGNGLFVENYSPKVGCGGGWVKLDESLEILGNEKMFSGIVKVGVNTHRTDGVIDNKESFFKKEYKILNHGSFAFFAELDSSVGDKLTQGISVFLGQNKSAFYLSAERHKNDLHQKINDCFSAISPRGFFYAAGDCYIKETPEDLFIADSQLFRHLTTSSDSRFYYRINKSESLYRLLKAGAVFYSESDSFARNENCTKIGMNSLVHIGGKQ